MRETEQLTFSFYFNCHLLLILAFLQNLAVRELRTRKTKLPAVEKKKNRTVRLGKNPRQSLNDNGK